VGGPGIRCVVRHGCPVGEGRRVHEEDL
jgi:hypothetical protein